MRETYSEAIKRVFQDEGGYSNDPGDSGGPTNWGITIYDARMYWKSNATASDVRNMPKSVAEEIYVKHYAIPLHYDDLPPGVDYAVLDYGINSGISRAERVYRQVAKEGSNPVAVINAIYDERERFLRGLSNFSIFGKGWMSRTRRGRALALDLYKRYSRSPSVPSTPSIPLPTIPPVVKETVKEAVKKPSVIAGGGAVVAGGSAAVAYPDFAPYIIGGLFALFMGFVIYKIIKGN